jgi:plasmid stabilization system protein ParE
MNVEFSLRARIDMIEILDFLEGKNPQAAVRLLDRLEDACLSLPSMPGIGTRRDDLAVGLRALSHRSYVIYFAVQTEQTLRIARIMHGSRDVKPSDFRPAS